MSDNKPKITVIYQDPPKGDGWGWVMLELLTAMGLLAAGGLIYTWMN